MKKIMIIGATGSCGSYTAIGLKSKGYNVVAVAHRPSDNGFFEEKGIPYFSIDIRKKETFAKLPTDIDVVLHFAGMMPAQMKGYNPQEYVDSIITGILNVLEWMREHGCKKIVFTQSIADILYKFGTTEPIDDDVERKFPLATDHSVYSICKNAAVNLIEHYHAQYGFKRFVVRLPTIYCYKPSPFYSVNGVKHWLGWRYIIDQAMKGNTLEVWGNPDSIKEMVYVGDFVNMMECCIMAEHDGGVYNMGCGHPVSIEYQIKKIAEVFNSDKKSDIIYKAEKPSSPQFVLSIEKARKELGYEPKYDFVKLLEGFKHDMETEPMAKIWGKKEDFLK
jgi:nucleoside-diphosphate-sugar epimerase